MKTHHEINRHSMFWKGKSDEHPIKLANLSNYHLMNIKKYIIKQVNKDPIHYKHTWGGFSWDTWIFAINDEKRYRDQLCNTMFSTLGTNAKIFLK